MIHLHSKIKRNKERRNEMIIEVRIETEIDNQNETQRISNAIVDTLSKLYPEDYRKRVQTLKIQYKFTGQSMTENLLNEY